MLADFFSYVHYVMTRVNYSNKPFLRSAMRKGYDLEVERLFLLRDFLAPVDFTEETNWTRTILHNLDKEENCVQKNAI
jgi:hypothetical protein